MNWTPSIIGIAAIGLAASCRQQTETIVPQEPASINPADPADAAFGYTDSTGSKLLMLTNDNQVMEAAKAKSMETAVCWDGREFPIRYLEFQKRGPADNGRQSEHNFSNDEGHLYEVMGVRRDLHEESHDNTCLLVPAGYLRSFPNVRRSDRGAGKQPVDSTPLQPVDAFTKDAVARIQTEKNRTVTLYWLLHRAGVSEQLAAVEFNAAGDSRLASLVLVEPGRLSFFDMPATAKDGDCWRVSDGCRFNPDNMNIPVVLGRPGEQLLVFTWQGEEGQLIILLQARGGKLMEVRRAYRYMLPL